jgi:hypothetical protein
MGWMIGTVCCDIYRLTGITLRDVFVDNEDENGDDSELYCCFRFPRIHVGIDGRKVFEWMS